MKKILNTWLFLISCQIFGSGNAFIEIDRDLVFVDVGCRWGFASQFVNQLDKFKIYGFDPDEVECKNLENYYNSPKISLFPIALLDHEGSATLYLTKQPACSSIFKPNEELIQNCPVLDELEIEKKIEIFHTTLDKWGEDHQIGPIDLLKIDTQGSEFLILKGGQKAIQDIRVIEVEVEFNPIYDGQYLFSDVDAFLRKNGFVLWRLKNLCHYGREEENQKILGKDRINYGHISQEVDSRGGQLFWADAIYIKKDIAESKITDPMQMRRDIELLKIIGLTDISDRLEKKLNIYSSQFLQDGFIHEHFFSNKRNGIFVDIGAGQPKEDSNSYFFESNLDWTGLCIEPHPTSFQRLMHERKCSVLNVGITPDYEGKMDFYLFEKLWGVSGLTENYSKESRERLERLETEFGEKPKIVSVNTLPITKVLESQNLFHIDFLSLDIQGGELEVLKAIDFNRFYIDLIAVENNWEDPIYHEAKNSTIRKYMEKNGYQYIIRLGVDEIYKKIEPPSLK